MRVQMLRQKPDLAEVNFWAPSASSFRALTPGEMFMFKLHLFLSGQAVQDGGRSRFGDLTLPALEKLAEAWAQELDPSWIEAKLAISD